MYKYCANIIKKIVQILSKYCTNIGENLKNTVQNIVQFFANILCKIFYKNCANIERILHKHFTNIMQILYKYCAKKGLYRVKYLHELGKPSKEKTGNILVFYQYVVPPPPHFSEDW